MSALTISSYFFLSLSPPYMIEQVPFLLLFPVIFLPKFLHLGASLTGPMFSSFAWQVIGAQTLNE